jgi:pimeloyl-ACP methyl ester carboxylesterase
MKELEISTDLGRISVSMDIVENTIPVVFLHGVFLDKQLWSNYGTELTRRSHIYIDMPAHGESGNVGHDWNLDDCVNMLMQILDALEVERCVVIGQSWGSMIALRAAHKHPYRFDALGLFNMPHTKTAGLRRLGFLLQKTFLFLPRFYAKQAAKSLYSEAVLTRRPELLTQMQDRMSRRSTKELARIIDAVILQPDDAGSYIDMLKVPALAVVGEDDYVGTPPKLETYIVPGRHISPHESVDKTKEAISRVLAMAL